MREKIPEEIFTKQRDAMEKIPVGYFKDADALKVFQKIDPKETGKDDFIQKEDINSDIESLSEIAQAFIEGDMSKLPEDILTPAFYENKIHLPLERIMQSLDSEQKQLDKRFEELKHQELINESSLSNSAQFDALEMHTEDFRKRKDEFKKLEQTLESHYERILGNFKKNEKSTDLGIDFPVDKINNPN